MVSFYLRAPIDDTAAGNNAKSPDTLHPPKLIVPRPEFPSFLPPSSLPIELGTYNGQLVKPNPSDAISLHRNVSEMIVHVPFRTRYGKFEDTKYVEKHLTRQSL